MAKVFNLPDLGEGLPDAEIHEWHVKEGDVVVADQLMVSVETAKAVVEVPVPFAGKILKLHGKPGDIIKTGAPFVSFEGDGEVITTDHHAPAASSAKSADQGTVVGNIQVENTILREAAMGITSSHKQAQEKNIIPAIRALARKLQVDLNKVTATGHNDLVTTADVLKVHQQQQKAVTSNKIQGAEPLRGVRRAMALSMMKSHAELVPVTIVDDADISAWTKDTDLTARLIQAIVAACKIEPALNALYDNANMAVKRCSEVNIGLVMDNEDGLFVPVIKDAESQSTTALRETIERLKQLVSTRSIPADELQGATISLSNFGTFAGRYANPIIVPPAVAILGAGRFRNQVVLDNDKPVNHRILPLSLTFDHRACTGGEASRFLGAVIAALQEK